MAKIIEKIVLTKAEMDALALIYEMFDDLAESTDDNRLHTACCNMAEDIEAFRREWVDD